MSRSDRRRRSAPPQARKPFGLVSATSLVAGSMLGIGIFLSPPVVARHVGDPWSFMAVWLLAGVFALGGAVACGELGAMLPQSGGDYVYQRAAFGPSVACAGSWVLWAAIFAGSIAATAVGLLQYQVPALLGIELAEMQVLAVGGYSLSAAQLVALPLVWLLTGVHALGGTVSARVQTALTGVSYCALLGLAVWALAWAPAETRHVAFAVPFGSGGFSAYGLVMAYMAAYFAYSGWNAVTYVVGEVRQPGKVVPRSIVGGTLGVTALYLIIGLVYLSVLGLDGLRTAGEAGSAVAGVLGGARMRVLFTVLVAVAVLATLNGSIIGGGRLAHSMSRGGALPAWLAPTAADSSAPRRALWAQALWASLLVLTGRFEQLLTLVSVAMVLNGTLTVASLYVLRYKRPGAPRPYRAVGYPWLPGLYILSSLTVVGVMLHQALSSESPDLSPLLGLVILVVAFIGARLGHWLRARAETTEPEAS